MARASHTNRPVHANRTQMVLAWRETMSKSDGWQYGATFSLYRIRCDPIVGYDKITVSEHVSHMDIELAAVVSPSLFLYAKCHILVPALPCGRGVVLHWQF